MLSLYGAPKVGIAAEKDLYFRVPVMSTLSLKLPESLLLRLDQESRACRVSKSAVVLAALERELEPAKSARATSCYDLARDLAGAVHKKLPKDMATNPKHMKSFGR